MKKQIKLLIENIFDDIYDIDQENNVTIDIADKISYNYHPKNKEELKDIIKQLLDKRGPDADLNDIDTSKITDMSHLFQHVYPQNIDIRFWDVSNVEDMSFMFYVCSNFNCDLSQWDVSKVKNMYGMFELCENFNSDLSQWDVSNVEIMQHMFYSCFNFEGLGLDNWKVKNCKNMISMFTKCNSLNCDLTNWSSYLSDNVLCAYMFNQCNPDFIMPEWYKERFNIDVEDLEKLVYEKYKNNDNIINILHQSELNGKKKYIGNKVSLWWIWWLILILKGPLSKKELLLYCGLQPTSYGTEFAKLSKQNIIILKNRKLYAVY